MQVGKLIATWLPIALGIVMIGAGAVNLVGPGSVRDSFCALGLSGGFSSGDGRARGDRRIAAADPGLRLRAGAIGSVAILSGRGDDGDPSSRLDVICRAPWY